MGQKKYSEGAPDLECDVKCSLCNIYDVRIANFSNCVLYGGDINAKLSFSLAQYFLLASSWLASMTGDTSFFYIPLTLTLLSQPRNTT